MVFTTVFGLRIALAVELDPRTAICVAIALTFSSTIIIAKLLSDKHEIDALHGRIALGFLIVQDIVVVVAMISLSAIALGASLGLGVLGACWRASVGPALVPSLFVLVGNPLIVPAIIVATGYRWCIGFLAGLTVAQISEFSLVFMTMGRVIGRVAPEALSLVTLIGLLTIAASTYMITVSHRLYDLCEPVLGIFERRVTGAEPEGGPGAETPTTSSSSDSGATDSASRAPCATAASAFSASTSAPRPSATPARRATTPSTATRPTRSSWPTCRGATPTGW